jgi:hypothetical protein
LKFSSSSLLLAVGFLWLKLWSPMLTLLLVKALVGTVYSWIRFIYLYQKRDEEKSENTHRKSKTPKGKMTSGHKIRKHLNTLQLIY